MESTEFSKMRDEDFAQDNFIFMKEELIITDSANQLDDTQGQNIVSNPTLENMKKDQSSIHSVKPKLEQHTNVLKSVEEEDDDIVIISEEKPKKSSESIKKLSQKTVIVPEIVNQMMIMKAELRKGNKVSKSIVFVKKCRLCQKIQKGSRSQSMIKCQDCDSKCFLFQCLLCFKRYTTIMEIFTHIDKKHENKIDKTSLKKRFDNEYEEEPFREIKVKSNKSLETNEKFHPNSNGLTQEKKLIIQLNLAQQINNDDKEADDDDEICDNDNDYNDDSGEAYDGKKDKHLLKEDLPLKQTERDIQNEATLFSCQQCNYTSLFKRYLSEHMKRRHEVIDPKNYPVCPVCEKKFRMQKDLKAHRIHCGKEPHLKCKFCPYKTCHVGTLKVHMQIHLVKNHNQNIVGTIPDVDSSSSNSNVIQPNAETSTSTTVAATEKPDVESVKNEMKNTIYAYCAKCGKEKPVNEMKQCTNCKCYLLYRCKLCSHSHINYLNTYQHVVNVHFVDREKPCPKCDKLVVELRLHLKICGIDPTHSCDKCPFKTKHKRSFVSHMRHRHQIDREDFYKCDKCGKQFAIHRYLLRHKTTYCDTQPAFGCAHCGLKTRSKGNLIRHLRLLHMETMTDVKFVCKKCDVEYRNVYMYDKHIKHCKK